VSFGVMEVGVVVEFKLGVVVAGGEDDFGIVLDFDLEVVEGGGGDNFGLSAGVGEIGDFGFCWLVVLIAELTDDFERIVGEPVGTFPVLFGTAV
jgi:hypothetical protein